MEYDQVITRRRLLNATLVLALAAATSCTHLKELIGFEPQQPKLQVTDIAVTDISLNELSLLVSLKVDNPNDFSLKFAGLRYQLSAADMAIAKGFYDHQVHIPAGGSVPVKLPLQVHTDAALRLMHELLTKSTGLMVILKATADFETPIGAMALDFEDRRPLHKLAGF